MFLFGIVRDCFVDALVLFLVFIFGMVRGRFVCILVLFLVFLFSFLMMFNNFVVFIVGGCFLFDIIER